MAFISHDGRVEWFTCWVSEPRVASAWCHQHFTPRFRTTIAVTGAGHRLVQYRIQALE